MAIGSAATPHSPTSYELVGRRIQRVVADPSVQKVQAVTISRQEDETTDAWERVLGDLESTDGVQVDRLEGGSVRIGWKQYIDN